MQTLARQRCLNHELREAVARCPECAQFYCRECITEHDDRVICASCLRKLSGAPAAAPSRRIDPWPLLQIGGGLAVAWLIFYVLGAYLLTLPDSVHDSQLWQTRLLDFVGMSNDE